LGGIPYRAKCAIMDAGQSVETTVYVSHSPPRDIGQNKHIVLIQSD